ncbi:MAG: hypothetical protein GOV00_03760, partial [Candidatus Altiarchaeota archaeon]|nr:hypothetical protein [Candidatus Altiarchaeota archaeon]
MTGLVARGSGKVLAGVNVATWGTFEKYLVKAKDKIDAADEKLTTFLNQGHYFEHTDNTDAPEMATNYKKAVEGA